MERKTEDYIGLNPCPYCHAPNDQASGIGCDKGQRPKQGDVSICMTCGGYLQFNDELKTVKMTDAEFSELEPEIQSVLKRSRSFIAKHNATN